MTPPLTRYLVRGYDFDTEEFFGYIVDAVNADAAEEAVIKKRSYAKVHAAYRLTTEVAFLARKLTLTDPDIVVKPKVPCPTCGVTS